MMWSFWMIIVTLTFARRRNFFGLLVIFKLLSQVRVVGLGQRVLIEVFVVLILVLVVVFMLLDLIPKFGCFQV